MIRLCIRNQIFSKNLFAMKNIKDLQGPTYDEIKERWNKMSASYKMFDAGPQTFYYTLANMLKLDQAHNILEIACGAGKLIPMALDLKSKEAAYFATDISEEMVKIAKFRLQEHFKRYQSKITYEEWVQTQRLEFAVLNGEEKIPKEVKFDRIFCNLVLMLTSDPSKMLQNLFESAEDGCLLGLSVWGDAEKNPVFSVGMKLMEEEGLSDPKARSNFFLYKQVSQLAQECGWQVVLEWDQVGMFPVLEFDENNLHPFLEEQSSKFPQKVKGRYLQEMKKLLNESKEGLQFHCQVAVLRKPSKKE